MFLPGWFKRFWCYNTHFGWRWIGGNLAKCPKCGEVWLMDVR